MTKQRDLSGYGAREWATRDGTVMKWSEMTTRHLRNTAAFIRRNCLDSLSSGYGAYCMVQGDMAEYYMEQSLASMETEVEEASAFAAAMEDYAAFRERTERRAA